MQRKEIGKGDKIFVTANRVLCQCWTNVTGQTQGKDLKHCIEAYIHGAHSLPMMTESTMTTDTQDGDFEKLRPVFYGNEGA